MLAEKFNAECKSEIKLSVYNKIFDFKHTTSKSSIPTGQGHLLSKRVLWNILYNVMDGTQRANYFIRSHIHEYFQMDCNLGFAITTPALQLPFTTYGRKFDNYYNVGFVYFDIYENGKVDFEKCLYKFNSGKENINVV